MSGKPTKLESSLKFFTAFNFKRTEGGSDEINQVSIAIAIGTTQVVFIEVVLGA